MTTIHFLSIIVVTAILIGSISVGTFAYADDDKDNKKKNKFGTLEEFCDAKNRKGFTGLVCDAVLGLQEQMASLTFTQEDPNEPVLELQVDPSSTEPALLVTDGTNQLFAVNNDGSIQIGSNTVIVNPDGTVTGGPLHLQAGSTVDGNLISTEPDASTTFSTYTKKSSEIMDAIPIEYSGIESQSVIVTCDLGDVALGGGGNADDDKTRFTSSIPFPEDPTQISTGWNATFAFRDILNANLFDVEINAWVICADITS